MLTGAPVVATQVDAIPYLIEDGVNGMLVEKDDWKTAAEMVVELRDRELRCKLIENGKVTVHDRFDARRVSRECEELYKEIVET